MVKYKIFFENEDGYKAIYTYNRIDIAIDSFWYFVVDSINAPIKLKNIKFFKNDDDITSAIILNTKLLKKYFKGLGDCVWSDQVLKEEGVLK